MDLVLLTFQTTQPSYIPTCNSYYPTTITLKHHHYLNLSKTLIPISIKSSRSYPFHKLSAYYSSSSSFSSYNSRPYVRVENDSDTLYKRISPVGDWNVSIVPILDQWVEEGRSVNKVQLQRIIRELRKYRRYKHSLEKVGVPESQILKFVTVYGQVTGKQHDKFCQVVRKVREMGFDLSSYSFRRAVISLCLVSDERWEAKCAIYRSFGFSDDEIVAMFKKMPAVGAYREKRISEVLEFYVKKLGWTPSRLVVMPYVIAFSLEKRTIPRCSVLQALELRKSISSSSGLYQILAMTNHGFLEKYVTAHMDEVPEVMDAYTGKLRFDEYNFRCRD